MTPDGAAYLVLAWAEKHGAEPTPDNSAAYAPRGYMAASFNSEHLFYYTSKATMRVGCGQTPNAAYADCMEGLRVQRDAFNSDLGEQ